MPEDAIVIVAAARTPMGGFQGALGARLRRPISAARPSRRRSPAPASKAARSTSS